MCGICGVFGTSDRTLIKKMLRVLKHRGPDDEGFYVDSRFSLGHTRLSIIDLTEKGKQPLANEDGSILLAINGEIYNFLQLRDELEKKGHQFYSNSDSEVVVHLYEEEALEFVNKLRGMYALALYDRRENKLVLARDPVGKKPLYYYINSDILVFASEIKAILEAGINKEIDDLALQTYLAYQYSVGEMTLFKGIKKLLPGHMMVLQRGRINIKKYWNIKESVTRYDETYSVKKLRTLLDESVKLRMVADVPVGAFLSGGIDSSAIVALARPHVSGNFHTFSVGFENFSELEYASIVSRHLGTSHHELTITDDMIKQDLQKIAWHYDEPIGDAAIINNYYLAREAAKHVKVVLAGEGGDELFAGYDNYKLDMVISRFFQLPAVLHTASKALVGFLLKNGDIYSCGNRLYRALNILGQPTLERAHLHTTRVMDDYEIRYLLNTIPEVDDAVINADTMSDPLNRMLALDVKNLLPEKFLMKADKATMAHSIEERLPLLDREIIEYAFTLPPKSKIKNGQEKYILRKAVQDLLPPEIVNRKKQGFNTPVDIWLSSGMKDIVYGYLRGGKIAREFFKRDRIESLLTNFNKRPGHRSHTIWTLFALELWYEVFLNDG